MNRPERSNDDFQTEQADDFHTGRGEGFKNERAEGSGFGHRVGEPGMARGEFSNANGFVPGRYPGRGRGRGAGRGAGGFGGKREFERHSGNDRTGVNALDKKDGSGSHNWGTMKDDLEEQMKDVTEEPQEWSAPTQRVENKNTNESTDAFAAPAGEAEKDEPKQFTLEEWKKMEQAKRVKSDLKLRKANEGADTSQWKGARKYRKSEGGESGNEEEDEEEDEEKKQASCE